MCLCLQLGARSSDLDSRANKRLEIGLIVFATINTLLQTTTAAQPDSVLTFPGFWSSAAVFGLTIAAAWGGCDHLFPLAVLSAEYQMLARQKGCSPVREQLLSRYLGKWF